MPNIIELQNIYKSYDGNTALENVNLAIPEGCIYGLLGPNGAGKTTSLRIITQIIGADSGTVYFEGHPIQPEDVQKIGYMPEERGLYKKMKVTEQALYLAQLKGLTRKKALEQIKYWFKRLEIFDWCDKKVEELSKGMAQKVQFVITILHKPKLLIFDEPFSGFDPINAQHLKNEILELKKEGTSIIFSTHNMHSVDELCDSIALINKSKVILSGQVKTIQQEYKKNMYEIIFNGDINNFKQIFNNPSHQLITINEQQGNYIAKIKITKPIENNELLKELINRIHIVSFREVLPSMDEIFIEAVNTSIAKDSNKTN